METHLSEKGDKFNNKTNCIILLNSKTKTISMGQPHLDFVKVREGACTPTRDTEDSVGYDLKSPSNYLIQAGTSAVIPTGLAIKIPKGYSGRLATKSVQAWRYS